MRKVVNKSRRVGFSEVASFRRATRALGLRLRSTGWEECRPANQNLLSASFAQSMTLLARVMRHVDALASGIPGMPIVRKRSATHCILSNGSEIVALSTNPRTARGNEGDLLCDEWASAPKQKALWAAAAPLAGKTLGNSEGYEIDVVSTPLGDADMFHAMCEGELSSTFSKHVVSVHTAIAQGFPITDGDLAALRLENDDETFAQEYECSFLAANTRYISADIYDAAIYYLDDPAWDPNARSPKDVIIYGGIDVARKRNLTSFCRLKKDADGIAWHDGTESVRGMAWDDQEAWVDRLARGCSALAVDATGIGSQFAERLANRFPGKVDPVDFTSSSKEEMATGLKLGLQRKRLRPRADDTDTRREVLSMRREITAHQNVRFETPSDGKDHGDRAWALALANRATGTATRTTRKTVAKSSANVAPPPPHRSVRVKRGAWQ